VASAGAASAERDVLLATKLHVPGPRPGFVARPRLARALGEGLARGLVVVCAPAGFGKTALLAGWVARQVHGALEFLVEHLPRLRLAGQPVRPAAADHAVPAAQLHPAAG
jgi:hypothetical protein